MNKHDLQPVFDLMNESIIKLKKVINTSTEQNVIKKHVHIIEELSKEKTKWFISLTDNNPEEKDCFEVSCEKEAHRIQELIENHLNQDVKENKTEINKPTFQGAVRPLMKYLCENHHPHTTVIVTGNTSEMVEGVETFNTDDYLID